MPYISSHIFDSPQLGVSHDLRIMVNSSNESEPSHRAPPVSVSRQVPRQTRTGSRSDRAPHVSVPRQVPTQTRTGSRGNRAVSTSGIPSGNIAIPFYDFYMCIENTDTTRLEKAHCIVDLLRYRSQPPHIIDTDKNYIVVNRDIIYDHLFTGR